MVSKKSYDKLKGRRGSKRDVSTVTSASNLVHAAMYEGSVCSWRNNLLGSLFGSTRECAPLKTTATSPLYIFKSWLDTNEDAKVVIVSIMVLLVVFWLVRTMLALIINLVCPVLVLLIGVLCIPPLREPLLGQNYPAVANFIRGVLLKIADSIV